MVVSDGALGIRKSQMVGVTGDCVQKSSSSLVEEGMRYMMFFSGAKTYAATDATAEYEEVHRENEVSSVTVFIM